MKERLLESLKFANGLHFGSSPISGFGRDRRLRGQSLGEGLVNLTLMSR